MHEYNICHRDLKLENVMIVSKSHDDYNVKIIDFGISKKNVNKS